MDGVTGGHSPHTSGTGSSSFFLKTPQCLDLLIIVLQPFSNRVAKKGKGQGSAGVGGHIEHLKTLCTQVFLEEIIGGIFSWRVFFLFYAGFYGPPVGRNTCDRFQGGIFFFFFFFLFPWEIKYTKDLALLAGFYLMIISR